MTGMPFLAPLTFFADAEASDFRRATA